MFVFLHGRWSTWGEAGSQCVWINGLTLRFRKWGSVCLWLVGLFVCMCMYTCILYGGRVHTNAHLCTWKYFCVHLSDLKWDVTIFKQLVALVFKALDNTGEKSFKVSQSDISWLLLPKKQEEMFSSHRQTLRLARPGIQKTCHFWKSGECDVSLRKGFFLLSLIPLCVPFSDWQLGMGVCVGGDRIHLLSAWLYMVCFVFATPGQDWHIEVFISRKQVAEERDELVCFSLFPGLPVCVHICTTPTCIL